MSRVTQYADPMLLVTTQTQNTAGQTAKTQSADRSDFGKMVRQKQKETRGQDSQKTQKQDSKDTQTAQKPQDGEVRAKGQETEITDTQYMLAAALLLQAGVQYVQLDDVAEETDQTVVVEMDAAPVIEAVTDEALPVVEEDNGPREQVVEQDTVEEAPETYHEVEHRVLRREEGPVEAVEEEQTEETEIEVTDAAETAQPVFGPVTAAPVKVADNTAPLDTRAPDATQQLATRIENLLVDQEEGSRVEFTLIPESLGKISVEIVRGQDGALHIQLSASTLRAADFLQRNTGGLQHLLANPNRPSVDVEVRSSQQTENPFLNPNAEQQQQQQRQQQEQNRRRRQEQNDSRDGRDFIQQLRLGLVEMN